MASSSFHPAPRLAAAALAFALAGLAPSVARAQGEVYGAEDLSSAPKLVSPAATARLVARSYPEDMRRTSTGGTVQLQFVIGTNGKVEPSSVEVVSTPAPALGAAAKAVAEKMEFVPGKKDGGAVRARVQLPIVYKP
jgi:protein TonB